MSEHTPGPWEVQDPMGSDVCLWVVQEGLEAYQWSCISIVTRDDEDTRHSDCRFITEDEQQANANLIAAAPELLAALKAARGVLDVLGGYTDRLARCDAAIAKAEGRTRR